MLDDIDLESLDRISIDYESLKELSVDKSSETSNSDFTYQIDENGILYIRCDNGESRSLKFYIEKSCPNGSKYNVTREISVIQFVKCSSSIFILDSNGTVYSFEDISNLKNDENNSGVFHVKSKKISLPLNCVKLAAGKSHCLFLIEKNSANPENDDLSIFTEKLNKEEEDKDFQDPLCECQKCLEERNFRLSAFMVRSDLDSVKERYSTTSEHRPEKLIKRETYTNPISSRFFSLKRFEQIWKDMEFDATLENEVFDSKSETNEKGELTRELWSLGKNQFGQLGHDDTVDRFEPKQISFFQDHFVTDIICGEEYSAALNSVGEVFLWGRNIAAQSSEAFRRKPHLLKVGEDLHTLSLSGSSNAAALLVLLPSSTSIFMCSASFRISRLPTLEKDLIPLHIKTRSSHLDLYRIERNSCASWVALLFDYFKSIKLLRELSLFYRSLLDNLNNDIHQQKLIEELHRSAWSCFQHFSLLSSFFNSSVSSGTMPGSNSIINFLSTSNCLKSAHNMITSYCNVEAFGCLDESSLSESECQVIDKLAMRCQVDAISVPSKLNAIQNSLLQWLDTLTGLAKDNRSFDKFLQTAQKDIQNSKALLENAAVTRRFWAKIQGSEILHYRQVGRILIGIYELGSSLKKISSVGSQSCRSWIGGKYHDQILQFNDIVIFEEKRCSLVVPIDLVWIEREPKTEDWKLITPEKEFIVCFDEQVGKDFEKSCQTWQKIKFPEEKKRLGSYAFTTNCSKEKLKGAEYDGEWANGRIEGRGRLKLTDGSTFIGEFTNGNLNGLGTYQRALQNFSSTFYADHQSSERFDEIRGVFEDGVLKGLAEIQYSNGDIYEGYTVDFLPHGIGVFKMFTEESTIMGEFKEGKPDGFAIIETTKSKYFGQCSKGTRHGYGALVEIDGSVKEGEWSEGEITSGKMMYPSQIDGGCNMEYEGQISKNMTDLCKGSLRVSPSVLLVGSFSGNFQKGSLRIADAVIQTNVMQSPIHELMNEKTDHFPVEPDEKIESRWKKLFELFRLEELGCTKEFQTSNAVIWGNIVSHFMEKKRSSLVLQKIPEYNNDWNKDYYYMVSEYWEAAINDELHPLYRLFNGLCDVFINSYSNIATHAALQVQASQQLNSFIINTYDILRILFPNLPTSMYEPIDPTRLDKEGHRADDSLCLSPVCEFLYESYFFHCSPILYTIYTLAMEANDLIYWNRLVYLNAHTDAKLLNYLGVSRELWPIEISDDVSDLEKAFIRNHARQQFYYPAIHSLQQMSTEHNPVKKLIALEQTFSQIQKCLRSFTESGGERVLNCDDLLPAFLYVVIRARLRRLGAEITFLDEFTRSYRGLGQADMMFTLLHSCYIQICREKSLV